MTNKVAFLTGASSGIGRALAPLLAAAGYDLALVARRLEELESLRDEILADQPRRRIEVRSVDVIDTDRIRQTVAEIAQSMGGIDLGIANAGSAVAGAIGKGNFEGHARTILVNLVGAMATCDALMEVFRAQNRGHLVGISSVAGTRGLPGNGAYCASKAGLTIYLESARLEVTKKPITVTTLLPGFIDTPINQDLEQRPFVISLDKGAKLIFDLIQKKVQEAVVPSWPWVVANPMLRVAPRFLIKKMG